MTVGVLTGGGDCPGLNAAIRAVVKTLSGKYSCNVIGFRDGFKGLVKNEFRKILFKDVSGLLDRGGTILGTSTVDDPLGEAWKQGSEQMDAIIQSIKENMAMHDMSCLIAIGGDETIRTAAILQEKGINTIAIPKSPINDIIGTDKSFGYMTAVETATEAIDKLHSTAESHHRVMIIEVLGNDSGWIAVEAGIAGGADVILIPEIPYSIDKVARAVLERKNAGKSFSIVVVSQGAKSVDECAATGETEVIRLGSVGELIADDLSAITGIDCEVTVLGALLRGGKPNTYDRLLSTRFGICAAENAIDGNFGIVVVLKGRKIEELPLEEAVNSKNTVEPTGDWIMMGKALGVCFGD